MPPEIKGSILYIFQGNITIKYEIYFAVSLFFINQKTLLIQTTKDTRVECSTYSIISLFQLLILN